MAATSAPLRPPGGPGGPPDAEPLRAPSGIWSRVAASLDPTQERPCLRREAIEVAHHRRRSGEPYVVLKNRSAASYLRLSDREHALADLMDGTRTVGELVVQYFLRHRVLAFPRIAALVARLREGGFLSQTRVDSYAEATTRLRAPHALAERVRGFTRWFLGREVAFDRVDGLFDRWYRSWGWVLFTWGGQVALAALTMLGIALFALNLGPATQRLFRVGDSYLVGAALLGAFTLAATAIHEIGHALALKHAGREVRRAGFLFYYGMPTFFVDTSDAWMAGPVARLGVSWAGPYTALILAGAASVGAFAAGPTPLGDLLWMCTLVCYLDALFNLNPLLELDGYYMLVDALERPRLRQDALAFVRGPLWGKIARLEPLTPDERLLGVFGLGAAAWSAFSIWLVVYLWETRLAAVAQTLWSAEGPGGKIVVVASATALTGVLWLSIQPALPALGRWLVRNSVILTRYGQAIRRRETVQVLRGLPFLAAVPERWLVEIAPLFATVRVLPGDCVVRQGDVGRHFYLVKRGTFEVLKNGESVALLGPGGYFGEIALLREVPRTATVVARAAGELLAMRGDEFRRHIGHELETFQKLQANVEVRTELAELPLFHGLSVTDIDLLFTKVEGRDYAAGETVLREGDAADEFFVIRSGQAQVESREQPVTTLGPGDYFGEIALLMDVPRTATVRAVGAEPLRTWRLGRQDFADILAAYLGLAPALHSVSTRRLRMLASI